MPRLKRALKILAGLAVVGALSGALGITGLYLYVRPDLPDVDILRDVHLQVPMRVFSRDGRLMAQFGEVRRIPVEYGEIPPLLVQAVVAAEDGLFVHSITSGRSLSGTAGINPGGPSFVPVKQPKVLLVTGRFAAVTASRAELPQWIDLEL